MPICSQGREAAAKPAPRVSCPLRQLCQRADFPPCGECESCKDLATGGPGSIDVVEIDAASHNGVMMLENCENALGSPLRATAIRFSFSMRPHGHAAGLQCAA